MADGPTAPAEAEMHETEADATGVGGRRRSLAGPVVIVSILAALVLAGAAVGADRTRANRLEAAAAAEQTAPSVKAPAIEPAGGPPTAVPVAAGRTIRGPTPCPAPDGTEERASTFSVEPPLCIDATKTYTAVFTTSAGTIEAVLDTTNTPATVNNFVVLSRYKFFDLSALFRTDPTIDIIQGGAPATQSVADPGPGYTISDEPAMTEQSPETGRRKGPYTYTEGDLVMANTGEPDSGGASFFFVTGPAASQLDDFGTFVTFGKVTKGLDLLQEILASHVECPPTDRTCLGGGPDPAVVITSLTIKESA